MLRRVLAIGSFQIRAEVAGSIEPTTSRFTGTFRVSTGERFLGLADFTTLHADHGGVVAPTTDRRLVVSSQDCTALALAAHGDFHMDSCDSRSSYRLAVTKFLLMPTLLNCAPLGDTAAEVVAKGECLFISGTSEVFRAFIEPIRGKRARDAGEYTADLVAEKVLALSAALHNGPVSICSG